MRKSREFKRLKRTREEHSYSYEKMAKKLNISKAYYWQIENGKRNLYYELAVHIAQIFEKKPDDIFYDDFINKD